MSSVVRVHTTDKPQERGRATGIRPCCSLFRYEGHPFHFFPDEGLPVKASGCDINHVPIPHSLWPHQTPQVFTGSRCVVYQQPLIPHPVAVVPLDLDIIHWLNGDARRIVAATLATTPLRFAGYLHGSLVAVHALGCFARRPVPALERTRRRSDLPPPAVTSMTAAICAIQVQALRPASMAPRSAVPPGKPWKRSERPGGHSTRGPRSGRAARTGRAVASAGPVVRPVYPAGLRLGGMLP